VYLTLNVSLSYSTLAPKFIFFCFVFVSEERGREKERERSFWKGFQPNLVKQMFVAGLVCLLIKS